MTPMQEQIDRILSDLLSLQGKDMDTEVLLDGGKIIPNSALEETIEVESNALPGITIRVKVSAKHGDQFKHPLKAHAEVDLRKEGKARQELLKVLEGVLQLENASDVAQVKVGEEKGRATVEASILSDPGTTVVTNAENPVRVANALRSFIREEISRKLKEWERAHPGKKDLDLSGSLQSLPAKSA